MHRTCANLPGACRSIESKSNEDREHALAQTSPDIGKLQSERNRAGDGLRSGRKSNSILINFKFGAEEGTRTPTPLRVHGPEPCASANSATSASDLRRSGGLTAAESGRSNLSILQGR